MKRIILIFSLMLTVFSGFTQVGIGTKRPEPSSMLEVKATNKGILIPRMTLAQRNSIKSPANSLMIYQTDNTPGYYYYASGNWLRIADGNNGNGASNTFTAPLNLNGTTVSIPQANATTNGFLTSTDWNKFNNVSNGTNQGDMLYWNGSSWVKLDAPQGELPLIFCEGKPTWGGCPAALTTTSASAITASTATVGGEITKTGGTSITDRGVVWSTTTSPTINLPTKQSFGSGSGIFSGTITGLEKLTTYYLRSYATNSAGTVYGNEISFTTIDVDITTGLVAFYPFNGNANDESGNGNHGTIKNGVSNTSDRNGNQNSAFYFDGFDGLNKGVNIPISIVGTSDYTISLWFQIQDSIKVGQNSAQTILCAIPFGVISVEYNHPYAPLKLMSCVGDSLDWRICAPNNPNSWDLNNKNQWHHLIMSKSQTAYSYYIDGVLNRVQNISSNFNVNVSSFDIGSIPIASGEVFSGNIDDIKIFKKLLSQSEITYLATH